MNHQRSTARLDKVLIPVYTLICCSLITLLHSTITMMENTAFFMQIRKKINIVFWKSDFPSLYKRFKRISLTHVERRVGIKFICSIVYVYDAKKSKNSQYGNKHDALQLAFSPTPRVKPVGILSVKRYRRRRAETLARTCQWCFLRRHCFFSPSSSLLIRNKPAASTRFRCDIYASPMLLNYLPIHVI